MADRAPTVSVALITYNHERFIADAIRSVLGQTLSDLELVVVDDGSTDRTPEVVASFRDPRLVSIRQSNRGPSAAWNRAIQAARGRYLAIMSGDDLCRPERLAIQVQEYARGNPRVLFSDVDFIGEDGGPARAGHHAEGAFDVTPHTRAQIIRRFFDRGNFLNLITCFTELRILREEPGPFNPLNFGQQDFDLWIRLIKRYDFAFLSERLVGYRILDRDGNLSSPTAAHHIRNHNEFLFFMRPFFDGMPAELFREAFGDVLIRSDCREPAEIQCEQAFLFLGSRHRELWVVGLERLHDLLRDPASAALLERSYGLTPPRFAALLKETEAIPQADMPLTSLYVDSGNGFNDRELLRQRAPWVHATFDLTFDLARFGSVRGLRWDPLELRHCRVQLQEVVWQDRAGIAHRLDPASVPSNGSPQPDGSHHFETIDPIFLLPIRGPVVSLRLRGRWEVDSLATSLIRTHALWERLRSQPAAGHAPIRPSRLMAPVRLLARGARKYLRRSA